jgi:hypothetical protein
MSFNRLHAMAKGSSEASANAEKRQPARFVPDVPAPARGPFISRFGPEWTFVQPDGKVRRVRTAIPLVRVK